ncbi:hypothetical protein IQ06DRAFT_55751 [Phaeosphaeriaceae sp. SRC1lsM3a]|nr:hypothetical protein IQ06DRAFT_55751 [Stagonospora sp. SRC1lsM3a]
MMYPNANDSRHHFPTNSILFQSTPDLRTPFSSMPHNPTLVNVAEAADMNVTALPVLPTTIITNKSVVKKNSVWKRMWDKIKGLVGKGKGKKEKAQIAHGEDEQSNTKPKVSKEEIGGPMDFQHVKTGGAMALRGHTPVEEGGESDWEDVEETRADLREAARR